MIVRAGFRENCQTQRGLAIVEFTLILPLLLILSLATAEFGRALYQYNAIYKSARDSVRLLSAVSPTLGDSDIQDDVAIGKATNLAMCGKITACGADEKVVPGLTDTMIPITYNATSVTVSINYPYQSMIGTALGALSSNTNLLSITLRASVTMRDLTR